MNRYEEIETFVRTVEAGSFSAAAEQLGIAKSVVSRRVTQLEKRLSVQLLVRSTRQLNLTSEGQLLYERASRLLIDWEEAEALLGHKKTDLAGSLRVSVPLSFGMAQMGPSILAFQKLHPGVSIDIDFTDRKVDLIAEGFDLAVRIGELPDSTLLARKLTPITTTAVASPDYLKAWGTPSNAEELKKHNELRFGLRSRKGWTYRTADGQQGDVELESQLRANNGDFLRDAAIASHGIAILPRFIVYNAIKDGRLIEVLPDYQWPALNAYAIYPSSKHVPGRVRALIDHLVECCGDGRPHWDK